MKKIVMMMLVLASMSVKVNAQWFVGGTGGIGYFGDHFGLELAPQAGYEFNNRWAAGLGVGFGVSFGEDDNAGYGILDPFVRFNCWNNSKLFIDLKAEADMRLRSNMITTVGFVPSLRYAFNDHWQLAVDAGLVGVRIYNDNCDPYFGFTGRDVTLNLIYKF